MTARVDPIPREARDFQGRRAGVVTRNVAGIIDIVVTALFLVGGYLVYCAAIFVMPPNGFDPQIPPFWVTLLVGYWVMTFYLGFSWSTGGRSYGCHVMGLRVVNRKGNRLPLITSLLRAGFLVFFPLGFYWVVISPANRSVQDVVLRTSVIYDWDVRPNHQRRVADED
jgi:uncharacterized RDD family membrane protein YckC